jgi:hypothetical protein
VASPSCPGQDLLGLIFDPGAVIPGLVKFRDCAGHFRIDIWIVYLAGEAARPLRQVLNNSPITRLLGTIYQTWKNNTIIHGSNFMAKQKSSKKPKRGTGWSIWLILIVIHSFIASFATLSLMKTPDAVTRQWLVAALLIFPAAKAIAALGMWEWKTWGLYLYVIAVLGTMGVALVLTSFLIWGIFYEAIPLLITGWLLRGKQQYFD